MTILDRLLDEMAATRGPIRSSDLAARLGISPSTLDGMLTALVARGRLAAASTGSDDPVACSGMACGAVCVGVDRCAFVAAVPRTHHVVIGPAG